MFCDKKQFFKSSFHKTLKMCVKKVGLVMAFFFKYVLKAGPKLFFCFVVCLVSFVVK